MDHQALKTALEAAQADNLRLMERLQRAQETIRLAGDVIECLREALAKTDAAHAAIVAQLKDQA
jgi:hypothetical protein